MTKAIKINSVSMEAAPRVRRAARVVLPLFAVIPSWFPSPEPLGVRGTLVLPPPASEIIT